MNKKILINNVVNVEVDFFFSRNLNILLLKGKLGILFFFLPNYYFYYLDNKLNFIFLNKYFFKTFLMQFFFNLKHFFKFYFFRIKLKGLGYRIRKMTDKLYRFFMAYNHYIYFYVSQNVFIWTKKRNMLVLSIDKIKLNNIFNQLLLLKKMDFFERTNSFIIPKKILFIKK